MVSSYDRHEMSLTEDTRHVFIYLQFIVRSEASH